MRTRRLAVVSLTAGSAALLATQIGFSARAASAPVAPGTVTAGAALLGVSPQVSGLTLTTTFGEADTAYQQTESQAKSGNIDLGGLGYFIAATDFCGHPGTPESQQPQPLTADSQNGPSTKASNTAGQAGEQVSVSPNPEEASAITAPLTETLPGILTVTGRAQSSVHYLANTEQEADSTVTENINLLNGLVEMQGITWTASRHAGASNKAATGFNLGQVMINHVPLPSILSPAAEVAAINKVIGLLGFTVTMPSSSSSSFDGSVTMSPLVLQFSGSSLDRTLLSPSVTAVTDLENAMAAQASPGTDCTMYRELFYNVGNTFDGLINLQLAIGQGAGALDFDFGGATAGVLPAPDYANPFDVPGFLQSNSGALPPVPVPPSNSSPPAIAPATAPNQSVGTSTPAPSTSSTSARSVSLAGVVVCRTMSPTGSPGCWRGLGSVAAGVMVALGAGLFAADVVYGRRRWWHLKRSEN